MQHSYPGMWDGNAYAASMQQHQQQQYQQAMAAAQQQQQQQLYIAQQQQLAPHAYAMQQQSQQQQHQQHHPYMSSVMHASPPAAAPRPSSPVASASAREVDVSYTPASHGYAQLISENARHILRSKHVQLGRDMGQAKGKASDVVGISAAKNISRVHATLGWEPVPPGAATTAASGSAWVVTCVGKNGLQHEGEFKPQHTKFVVRHKDRLQIGDTVFFFIEPKRMNADMTNTQAMQ